MENNQIHDACRGRLKETPLILSRNRYGDVFARKVLEYERKSLHGDGNTCQGE